MRAPSDLLTSPARIAATIETCLASCAWRRDGLVAFGPFEGQGVASLYFSATRPFRLLLASHFAGDYSAELYIAGENEARALRSPWRFFVLEFYNDGSRSGSFLSDHEADALLAKWQKANEARFTKSSNEADILSLSDFS